MLKRNWKGLGITACVLLAGTAAAQDEQLVITLVCTGTGTSTETQTTYVNSYQKHEDSKHAVVQTTGKQSYNGTAYVEINGAFARVKVPSPMLPPINSGNDGWFKVKDLFINDREVTGKLRLNGLNKPKLRIDRTTGTLSLGSGFADFTGQCEKQDPNKRAF